MLDDAMAYGPTAAGFKRAYRLRLIQTDLIANRTTSKEIPIAIAP